MVGHHAEEGKKWPKVYLIDCGLCLKLTPREGAISRKLVGGFARWKSRETAEAYMEMGPHGGKQEFTDFDPFLENLDQVFRFYQESSGKNGAIIGRCLESCFDVIRDHKIQLDSWATNLLFGVLVQESMIITMDEDYNCVKKVLPWLVKEGHFGWGMFRNQFGFVPFWVKCDDDSAAIADELRRKGQLTVEDGLQHEGWKGQAGKECTADARFRGGVLGAGAPRISGRPPQRDAVRCA